MASPPQDAIDAFISVTCASEAVAVQKLEEQAFVPSQAGKSGKSVIEEGNTSIQEEAEYVDERFASEKVESANVVQNPPLSPHGNDRGSCLPSGDAFRFDEWGGISSEEHDEAVALEAAMFDGISEEGAYNSTYPPPRVLNPGSSSNFYARVPRPPSPSLAAQSLLRGQQDDEYLPASKADREKEMKAVEEAECRRLGEAAAILAALDDEKHREEEARTKVIEQEGKRRVGKAEKKKGNIRKGNLKVAPFGIRENSVLMWEGAAWSLTHLFSKELTHTDLNSSRFIILKWWPQMEKLNQKVTGGERVCIKAFDLPRKVFIEFDHMKHISSSGFCFVNGLLDGLKKAELVEGDTISFFHGITEAGSIQYFFDYHRGPQQSVSDDEYLPASKADREKEMKVVEEAKGRRLEEAVASLAALGDKQRREEEARTKVIEQEVAPREDSVLVPQRLNHNPYRERLRSYSATKGILDSLSLLPRPEPVPLGPSHQAEVPDWTPRASVNSNDPDELKWIGTQILPRGEEG